MSAHFMNKCIHGMVLNQCRCPDPNKIIHLVACPDFNVLHEQFVADGASKPPQSLVEPLSAPEAELDLQERLDDLLRDLSAITVKLNQLRADVEGRAT